MNIAWAYSEDSRVETVSRMPRATSVVLVLFLAPLAIAADLAGAGLEFTDGVIPPIAVVSEGHISAVKNAVKFDVYFDHGPKSNVAIYAINTGRK